MKLTKSKIKWIHDKVQHYCNLLQVSAPRVFFIMAEYNRWKVEKRKSSNGSRVGRTSCLGVCHRSEGVIVILVKRAKNLIELDNTIRHELVHYTKPSYNHYSKEFIDRMKRLKNGKIKNGRFIK